jgi:hypothetical protein
LGRRALGRALLARQLLLRRAELTPAAALEHLVGLQAQAPNPPYYGLWSRLEGFDPNELCAMITSGDAVRLKLLRGTVHLVTAADALALRPLLQSVGERGHAAALRRRMEAADLDRLAAVVGELLAGEPMSAREIAAPGRARNRRGRRGAHQRGHHLRAARPAPAARRVGRGRAGALRDARGLDRRRARARAVDR